MTTDPYFPPPPYTPSDPLTPATTQAPDSPLRLRGGDEQTPVYSQSTASDRVLDASPAFENNHESPHFSSAAAYFEERGLRVDTHDDATLHQLFISPTDRAEDIARIPLCWRNRTNDLTQADMSTFANFLLPPVANAQLPPKLRADLATDEKAAMSPTDTETDAERRARMSLVVAEWNESFFYPRGLLVELASVPRHPLHAARGLDPICQSCVEANNSASRYAAQARSQALPPPMPHGMGLPPLPPMPHGPGMFPHGLPHLPPMTHGPAGFPQGFPPHAPYGRMPFRLGHLRDGIERFASGRGRSRGRGCEEYYAGRGGFHSSERGHHHFHHHRRRTRSSSSSSSRSSSRDPDHGNRHPGRHVRGDRGRGRGRGFAEARGHRHERDHRRRGRSSSTSSSSSSNSDSSIDSISSRDVRGLGLQDVVRGIAAMKLDKEGKKLGLKMGEMGKKFGVKMDEVGKKIDAKTAVGEIKSGLREMKRESCNDGRAIGKEEKKAVKRELKGLKKDLKRQLKEVKRKRKELKREGRDRRREGKRHDKDGERCGERWSRGWACTEQRAWVADDIDRADTEGQVSGVTQTQDADDFELRKDVKS